MGFQLSAVTFGLFAHSYRHSAFKVVWWRLGPNPVSANKAYKSTVYEIGSYEKKKENCGQDYIPWGHIPLLLLSCAIPGRRDSLGNHISLAFPRPAGVLPTSQIPPCFFPAYDLSRLLNSIM